MTLSLLEQPQAQVCTANCLTWVPMVRNMVDLSQIAHDGCTFAEDKIAILHKPDQLGTQFLLSSIKLYSFSTFKQGILANGLILTNSLLRASPAVTLTKHSSTSRLLNLPSIKKDATCPCVHPYDSSSRQCRPQHVKIRRYLQKSTHALAGCESRSMYKVTMSTACCASEVRNLGCCNSIAHVMASARFTSVHKRYEHNMGLMLDKMVAVQLLG